MTDRESFDAILSLVKVKSCHYWLSHEHLNSQSPHFSASLPRAIGALCQAGLVSSYYLNLVMYAS